MGTDCPTHVASPSFQLGAGKTGRFDCTAHAASDAIDHSTCGKADPGGRDIRLMSSEPVPDPRSPGLNLWQVAEVARRFGTHLDVFTGSRALTWEQYEAARRAGRGAIIQVGYGPIADSPYAAGRGFRGGHALFESIHSTEDPLADGRAPGVYDRLENGPVVYPRDLMRAAAASLILGYDAKGHPIRAGLDRVWCALTRDVAPVYRVNIRPRTGRKVRRYRSFVIEDGKIVGFRKRRTRGFSRPCSTPRTFAWEGDEGNLRALVRVRGGAHNGEWVRFYRFAEEV